MDLGLKDKVAFVAGASQGIGKASAIELGKEGAKVAICALDDPELPKAFEEIRSITGNEVIGIAANLTVTEEARDFIRKGLEHFRTVDILVNNSGGPPDKKFLEIDEELWNLGFRLNLLSTITMTREVVPVIVEKHWGRIINMTSVSVKQPIEGLILSNTIRIGVVGFAKTLSPPPCRRMEPWASWGWLQSPHGCDRRIAEYSRWSGSCWPRASGWRLRSRGHGECPGRAGRAGDFCRQRRGMLRAGRRSGRGHGLGRISPHPARRLETRAAHRAGLLAAVGCPAV